MAFTLVFIGPPGCGKGTHAGLLAEKYGFMPVSVGEMLRKAVKQGTETGEKVKELMGSGTLVPDEIVLQMVRNLLDGFSGQDLIFDGFPRTLSQARLFDDILPEFTREVNTAVFFKVSDSEVIRRISGRRIDPATGIIYHIDFNPPPPGVRTIQRDDDHEDIIRTRLAVYHSQTAPVVDYYRSSGKLVEINGEAGVEEVFKALAARIEELIT